MPLGKRVEKVPGEIYGAKMKSQCTVNSELFRENTAMKIQLEYF
jgi:hypothetical protein